jgi:hypothetical protein
LIDAFINFTLASYAKKIVLVHSKTIRLSAFITAGHDDRDPFGLLLDLFFRKNVQKAYSLEIGNQIHA